MITILMANNTWLTKQVGVIIYVLFLETLFTVYSMATITLLSYHTQVYVFGEIKNWFNIYNTVKYLNYCMHYTLMLTSCKNVTYTCTVVRSSNCSTACAIKIIWGIRLLFIEAHICGETILLPWKQCDCICICNSIQWNLLIRTLENMDTCIIHTLSYGPKWCFII